MNMILKQKVSELKGEFQQNENQRDLNESKTKMQQEYIERLQQDNQSIIYRFIDSQPYNENVHLTNLVGKIKQIHNLPFDKKMTTIKLNNLIDSYSSLNQFSQFEYDSSSNFNISKQSLRFVKFTF